MNNQSFFKTVYGYFLIFLLVVITAVWIILTLFLRAYEQSQPKTAVKEYCSTITAEHVSEICQPLFSALSPLQEQTQIVMFLQNGISSADPVRNSRECNSTTNVYYLHDGSSYIEKLILTPGEDLGFGLKKWAVTGEEILIAAKAQSYNIKVPESYSLYVNEKLLDSSYRIADKTEYSLLKEFYGSSYKLPYLTEYSTGPLIGNVSMYAVDSAGNTIPEEQLREDVYEDNCSAQTKEELTQFCWQYFPAYIRFLSNADRNTDGNYMNVIQYVETNSPLASRLRDAKKSNGFNSSLGDEIQDVAINKTMDVGNGYYVVDSSLHYLTTGQNRIKTEMTTNIKLMIHCVNGVYKAVDMAQH